MSEAEPRKKRRFWQLHLSTAVLLMFVSGSLVGSNTRDRDPVYWDSYFRGLRRVPTGWPFEFKQRFETYDAENDKVLNAEEGPCNVWSLAGDIFTAIGICSSVAFISEWLIRRREGRRP